MKQLNITFEDKEHMELEYIKKQSGLNWHDFIIEASKEIRNKYKGVEE